MPTVRVFFRYDTEEFTTPACRDVTLRIARMLTDAGFTATFITVGELARVWEREGHSDVIEAVTAHDVGCHTNLHSVHPLPPAYTEGKTWRQAVGEVIARETQAVTDIRRLFGRTPSCWTQAGAAWTPAFLGAMRAWDVPAFWDATSYHSYVSMDEKPFRLAGILNFIADRHAPEICHLCISERPGGVEKALAEFRAAAADLGPAGGTICLAAHPGNLNTTRSWDLVNFPYGNNSPRQVWGQPPFKSTATIEANFRALDAFARAVAAEPSVMAGCARELPSLFPDPAQGAVFGADALKTIAESLADEITFIPAPDCPAGTYLSAAETVLLLASLATDVADGRGVRRQKLTASPCGPEVRVESRLGGARTIAGRRAVQMAVSLYEHVSRYGLLPSSVEAGGMTLGPAEYAATLCGMAPSLLTGEVPKMVELRSAPFTLERYDTSARADWDWKIYPIGFDAPDGRELARLQTWSLKPAVRIA